MQFSKKDKKNNIFPCKNLKTTKLKLQTQFSRHYFHDQNVEKHKKDKIEYCLFPNLSVFIISVFQKNSKFLKFSLQYGFLRYYLTTEKDLFICIKNKKRWKWQTTKAGLFSQKTTFVANKNTNLLCLFCI